MREHRHLVLVGPSIARGRLQAPQLVILSWLISPDKAEQQNVYEQR